ncbi:hypothetical protein E2C01_083182 [Portunus trituberculatus]|uniref:Uncharacterized protein n=1 Tax=Portunus trituberculatus TaxID=210409 RepID=A0A5B7IWJ0_PORTR|nr:hypothetical protein [Portunus trituberculatus]
MLALLALPQVVAAQDRQRWQEKCCSKAFRLQDTSDTTGRCALLLKTKADRVHTSQPGEKKLSASTQLKRRGRGEEDEENKEDSDVEDGGDVEEETEEEEEEDKDDKYKGKEDKEEDEASS